MKLTLSQPPWKRLFLLLLIGASLLALCVSTFTISSRSNTAQCQNENEIVFWSVRQGIIVNAAYIDMVCADGSGEVYQSIAPELEDASRVVVSPDGTKLAFVSLSAQDAQNHIFVMNIDGSGLIRLSSAFSYENDPAWSSDGQHLAFRAYVPGSPDYGIYVTDVVCLETGVDCASTAALLEHGGASPTWSPDGKKIAFEFNDVQNDNDFNYEIYVIDVDGLNRVNLTRNEANDYSPAWSRDGKSIAFYSLRTPPGIYLMNADGSNATDLTDGYKPAWSPDSRHIAFISDRDSKGERIPVFESSVPANALYLITRDGTKIIKLTHHDREHITEFAWLP
jgi:Tol biopolymer transport system component